MNKQTVLGVCGVLAVGLAGAQEAPQPSPEQKKTMSYFVGKWTTEGDVKPSPFGPGGKMASRDSCEWFAGGFQVVCRGDGKSPMGSMTTLGVLAYNAAEKGYTFYGIDSLGMSDWSKGSKDGNTWTFASKSQMGGQTMHSRYTMTETSPTSYTFRWDTSPDGSKWSTVMEGKSTRAGS